MCLWSFETTFIYTRGDAGENCCLLSKSSAFLRSSIIHIPFVLFLWTKVPSYSNACFCWRHGMVFPDVLSLSGVLPMAQQ